MRPGTHHDIRGFDADDQIVIAHFFYDMDFVQCTLYQSLGSNSMVFLHQFFLKRTAVDADTDRNISLLCNIYDCLDPVSASDVARIDTDLVCAVLHCCDRKAIIKMDICHKRNVDLFLDLTECLGSFHCRNCTADDLTSCRLQFKDLTDSCLHIFCLGICHRLDKDRVSSSDLSVSYLYYLCMVAIHKFPSILSYFTYT